MNIDEFLEKELEIIKKEDIAEKPVVSDSSQEGGYTKKEGIAEKPIVIDASREGEYIKHFFDLWGKVAEAKFKWDGNLYSEINRAAEKVKEQLDNVLLELGKDKKAIKKLIGKALIEIENKNYEAAAKLYSEISDMRNKFPDFLLEDKKELNREIFMLYGKLHDQIDLKFIEDFKGSIAKVKEFIRNSMLSIDDGDTEKAKVMYENALEAYKSLPNGFLQQKMELGSELLKLYKDLSIQTQITELQQQLSTPNINYAHLRGDSKLVQLSEIIKHKRALTDTYLPNSVQSIRAVSLQPHIPDKPLLSQLISRKLKRARINMEKELYSEVKRNIDAVLKVDPDNAEARQLLRRIPMPV